MSATSIDAGRAGAGAESSSLRSFLGELLAEQQRLETPVARFSRAHDRSPPALAPVYRDLIPLGRPGPGEQYAFEVELDACTGCKACVSACHSMNGLDEGETWRDAGLLVGAGPDRGFTQTITTACHHCADPGCLNGCPVLAYEKDPATGIVRHLDDQCIGCSYCIFKCPYDAPKYNPARGIVRKCDLCHGRLEHGEAPACVQACPTRAIRVVTVRAAAPPGPSAGAAAFLPGAPDPGYTRPTTRYLSRRGLPAGLAAGDAAGLRPEPAHWPLAFSLTLLALGVGADAAAAGAGAPVPLLRLGALAGAAGLAASVFHLGRPLRAWRIFLGLRRSWLSREVLVFVCWWVLAAAAACLRAAPRPLLAAVAALGLSGLLCSAMVYADTRRAFWRWGSAAPRILGSALVLGLASALLAAGAPSAIGFVLAAATLAKLGVEARAAFPGTDPEAAPAARQTAGLLAGPLRGACRLRLGLGLAGGVLAPLLLAAGAAPRGAAWAALALAFGGELAERHLFFRAVVAPRMPGAGPP